MTATRPYRVASQDGRQPAGPAWRWYTSVMNRLPVATFDLPAAELRRGYRSAIYFSRAARIAEAHPDLVCSLHRGMVEGFVETMGDADVLDFHPLAHRQPCQVSISSR